MTRVFFGETYFSHGVMSIEEAETFIARAKAAGFKTARKKNEDGVEVFVK